MLSILIPVLCVVAVGLAVLMGSAAKQAAIEREAAIEKIAVFWYAKNDTYLETVRTALNARLDTLGIEHNDLYADNRPDRQLEQVKASIAGGSDLLLVNLADWGYAEAAEEILAAAGDIPVIFSNRSIGANGTDISVLNAHSNTCYIGTAEDEAGRLQGTIIGDYLLKHYHTVDLNDDGYISYAMMLGRDGNAEAISRTLYSVENANEILTAAGKPALSYFDASSPTCYQADPDGAWSATAAAEYMLENLDSFNEASGNMIELVICNNDLMAMGVVEVLMSAGYNYSGEHTVPVFGIDGMGVAKEMVAEGVMAGTVSQDAEGLADAIYQTVTAVVAGNTPAEALAGLTDDRFSLDPDCPSKLYVAYIPCTAE